MRCHLQYEQQVVFDEGTEEEIIEKQNNTELTEFFQFNTDFSETDVRYVDFPKQFTWNNTNKKWTIRKSCFDTIGRVHSMNPLAGDVFYLRMLLHHDHCRGRKSFQDLRTVDGTCLESYQEVCRVLGLLQDDKEWDEVDRRSSNKNVLCIKRVICDNFDVLLSCQPSGTFQQVPFSLRR